MDFKLLFGSVISFILYTYVTGLCEIKDRKNCTFTVICERRVDNLEIPKCQQESNVSFIITGSIVNPLTAEFFSSTNFDHKVRIIIGVNNVWTNIATRAFMYYTKVREIDLSSNHVANIKNEAFQNLFFLKSLNLSSNSIRHLYEKTLYINKNKDNQFELLDISKNKLTDINSECFGYVPNLKVLYLQNNELESIKNCFTNNTKMRYLNLRHNRLSSLNMSLANLKSLKKLDISHNRLRKLNSHEVNRLLSLQMINMSNNQIEFIEKGCFKQAYNLTVVDLSHNRITIPIDSTLFLYNNRLQYLDLFHNDITVVYPTAFKYNKLCYLNLGKNNLSIELIDQVFSGLENVTHIDWSNQSIKTIRANAFSNLNSILHLNLSLNKISTVENFSFYDSFSLSILDLSHNKISRLSFLRNCLMNLTELYLKDNRLVKIPKYTFANMTKLRKLDLSENWIRFIENNALPLKKLHYINLKHNELSGVLRSSVLSPAKYLTYLDLSEFEFFKIDRSALVHLPVMTNLNISHNEIVNIDLINFIGMPNLNILDLSYNRLSRFVLHNSNLPSLRYLYLSHNDLTAISKTLMNMTNLVYVDFSYNDIVKLSDAPFSSFKHLKVLRLSNNKIKQFNNPEINSLTQLTTLSILNNEIAEINLNYFENLVVADISRNNLTHLHPDIVRNLKYLQFLDLNRNNIYEIAVGTFFNLPYLRLLNLSHNHLSNIPFGAFSGLTKMLALDLSYNDIGDVDVFTFHDIKQLKKMVIDYNQLKTLDVEGLASILPKLQILSMGGNPIPCKEYVQHIKNFTKTSLKITSIHKIINEENVHGIKCGGKKISSMVKKFYSSNMFSYTTSLQTEKAFEKSKFFVTMSPFTVASTTTTIASKKRTTYLLHNLPSSPIVIGAITLPTNVSLSIPTNSLSQIFNSTSTSSNMNNAFVNKQNCSDLVIAFCEIVLSSKDFISKSLYLQKLCNSCIKTFQNSENITKFKNHFVKYFRGKFKKGKYVHPPHYTFQSADQL